MHKFLICMLEGLELFRYQNHENVVGAGRWVIRGGQSLNCKPGLLRSTHPTPCANHKSFSPEEFHQHMVLAYAENFCVISSYC